MGAGTGQAFGDGPAAFLGSTAPEVIPLKNPPIGLALVAVALTIQVTSPSAADEPGRPDGKLKVVVFGGHPDDPKSVAGGLVAMLTRQGYEVISAHGMAFRGGRKFFDRPEVEIRRGEATAACEVLKANPKFFPYAHELLGRYLRGESPPEGYPLGKGLAIDGDD